MRGDLPCLELRVQLLRLLQLLLLLGGRGVRPLCLLETGLLLHRLQVRQHGLLLLLLLLLVVLLKLLLRLVLLRRRRRRRRLLLRLHRAGMRERRIVGEQRARERVEKLAARRRTARTRCERRQAAWAPTHQTRRPPSH